MINIDTFDLIFEIFLFYLYPAGTDSFCSHRY